MGRTSPNAWVCQKDAAKVLGITVRCLHLWTRQGLVTPSRRAGQKELEYRLSDLQLLRRAREDKNSDIWHVKAQALQALSIAKTTEVRLAEVLDLLGLNAAVLERDEDSIKALYKDAEGPVVPGQLLNVEWVRFWGGAFFGIDEVYLELVTRALKDDEPWKRFMDFSCLVTREALKPHSNIAEAVRAGEELRAAYKYFQAGARHLWYIGYMHCRRVHGRRVADTVFDGSHGAVDELMAILH